MDNEKVMYSGARPWKPKGYTVDEARDVLLKTMGAGLNPLDTYGTPIPDGDALRQVHVDRGAQLPYDQSANGYPNGLVDREHWPRINDPVDTVYRYQSEPQVSARQPATAGLNRFGYQPAEGDAELLGRALYAEGRGEMNAWPGLAWSIVNRVDPRSKGKRKSLYGVLSEPGEFEDFGKKGWTHDPRKMAPSDRAAFDAGNEIARGVLAGEIPDPVRGGTFFYSSKNYLPPRGADGFFGESIQSGRLKPTMSIGGFTFLKDMTE